MKVQVMKSAMLPGEIKVSIFIGEDTAGRLILRRRYYFPSGNYLTDPDRCFAAMPTDKQIAAYLE